MATKSPAPIVNQDNLKKSVLALRAINHNLRQKMIHLVREEKSLTVTEIYVKLRIEQSVASQHLAVLRKSNMLNTEREGKFIHYTVNEEAISEISKIIEELAKVAK